MLTPLLRNLVDAIGLVPAPPGHADLPRRDPTWSRNGRNARTPFLEHIMNETNRSTTMWRNSDTTRPPLRPLARHAGHRPRATAGQRLAQALFDRAGPLARLVRHGETQWASATFTGARHTFVLRFDGAQAVADAEALTHAISDDELTIQRALIAELTVTRFSQTLLPEPSAEIEISALLLDQ